MSTSKACRDCVDVHGDDPVEWLADCPEGATWQEDYQEYLCDGCRDERDACAEGYWSGDFYA